MIVRVLITVITISVVCEAQSLRLYHTNRLADLSAAVASGPNSNYSNYWVIGTVTAIYGKCLIIERPAKEVRFFYGENPSLYGGSAELLSELAASRISNTNGITLGHFMSLSPEMRTKFVARRKTERIAVLNFEGTQRTNTKVGFCGLGIGKLRVLGEELNAIDCGTGYSGNLLTNAFYLKAFPSHLERIVIKTNALPKLPPTSSKAGAQ